MNRLLLLFLTVFVMQTTSAQDEDDLVYFSEMIALNLQKYKNNSNIAYERNNIERAEFLFDSLVQNVLVGTQLDDFKVSTLSNKSGKKKAILGYEKPLFLITTATWCIPDVGELPALNELAEKYHDQIDFMVLFFNKRSDVRKVSNDYSRHIEIAYVDETDNKSSNTVNKLKHVFGIPTAMFINEWGEIIDIQREVSHPYGESDTKSYELHYNYIAKGISMLIAELEVKGSARKNRNVTASDARVYDEKGFDQYGFDKNGYDENGFDEYGFNKDGFDRRGFDELGFDKDGYDDYGFDKDGFDRNGMDENGKKKTN